MFQICKGRPRLSNAILKNGVLFVFTNNFYSLVFPGLNLGPNFDVCHNMFDDSCKTLLCLIWMQCSLLKVSS